MAAATTVAELVVQFLIRHGVDRVFGLQGGHIQPIWDHLGQRSAAASASRSSPQARASPTA